MCRPSHQLISIYVDIIACSCLGRSKIVLSTESKISAIIWGFTGLPWKRRYPGRLGSGRQLVRGAGRLDEGITGKWWWKRNQELTVEETEGHVKGRLAYKSSSIHWWSINNRWAGDTCMGCQLKMARWWIKKTNQSTLIAANLNFFFYRHVKVRVNIVG